MRQANSLSFVGRLMARLTLLLPKGRGCCIANFDQLQERPNKILCVAAAGIGDTIMVAAAVKALKDKFSDSKISMLVHYNRGSNEVCHLMPCVDETIDIGLANYRWLSVIKFMLGGFWKLLFELRKEKFDLAVVFMPNPIRRLLLAGLGIRYWIYGNRIDDYPGALAFDILGLTGVQGQCEQNVFEIPEPGDAEQILPSSLKHPIIAVHPFCGMAWRQWDKFDKLQQKLSGLAGSVVVVGRKVDYVPPAASCNLVNKLSIAQLFWVIKNCDVFIAADSGPMHIGFALDRPTVALFGPVDPSLRVPPWKQESRTIIYKPSVKSEKTKRITQRKELDNSNMHEISVDEVLSAVESILNQNA